MLCFYNINQIAKLQCSVCFITKYKKTPIHSFWEAVLDKTHIKYLQLLYTLVI